MAYKEEEENTMIDKFKDMYHEWNTQESGSPDIKLAFQKDVMEWQDEMKRESLRLCDTDVKQFMIEKNLFRIPPVWSQSRPLSLVMIWATWLIENTIHVYGASSSLRKCRIVHVSATHSEHNACAANLAKRTAESDSEQSMAFIVSYDAMSCHEYRKCAMGIALPLHNGDQKHVCTLFIADWYINFISLSRIHRRQSQRNVEGIFNDCIACALCFGPDHGGLTLDATERENRLAQCPFCNAEHCQKCLEDELHSCCIQCGKALIVSVDPFGVIQIEPQEAVLVYSDSSLSFH